MVSLLAESDAPGCNRLAREVRLVDGLDRVEIMDLVDKKPVRAVEGVHFGFSFNVPEPGGSHQQPGRDRPAGNRPDPRRLQELVLASSAGWTSRTAKQGVTWVHRDAPLMELGGLTANLPRGQPNPERLHEDHQAVGQKSIRG